MFVAYAEGGTLFLAQASSANAGMSLIAEDQNPGHVYNEAMESFNEDIGDVRFPGGFVDQVHCGCADDAMRRASHCAGIYFEK